MKKTNRGTDYKRAYPIYLTPERRLWVTKEGDLLEKDGVTYEVIQVLKPLLKGTVPKLVLKPHARTSQETTDETI